jgi:SAM-dependent methyltransferase
MMQHCPACHNASVRSEIFDEGTIYLCSQCKLQWADRRSSAIEGDINVTGFYGRYMDPTSINPPTYAPYCDFFAQLDKRFGKRKLNILDIGCGNGVFLAEAMRRGYRVTGIELDVRHRTTLPIEVSDRVIFSSAEVAAPSLDQQFDVVAFWDSFEHIDDPFSVIEMIRPKLAENAVIFARVNNTHDIVNMLTRVALRLFPKSLGRRLLKTSFNLPQHAWNFSVAGMTALLEHSGWSVESHRVTETASSRLTANHFIRLIIETAYLINRLIGGGKIGEYWFSPKR